MQTTNNANLSGVCWRPEWVRPHESLWSLIAKFTYLNAAIVADLHTCFAGPASTDKDWRAQYLNRSLNTFSLFDGQKLSNLLALDKTMILQGTALAYLKPNEIAALVSDQLRYCSTCIGSGYHSTLHQLLFLPECPIHGVRLLTQCSQCGRLPQRYTLTSLPVKGEMDCAGCSGSYVRSLRRGSQVLPNANFRGRELRELVDLLSTRMRNLSHSSPSGWIKLQKSGRWKTRRIRQTFVYWHEAFSTESTKSRASLDRSHGYARIRSTKNEHLKENKITYRELGEEITDELTAVYKAIQRNLIKNTLRGHRSCIAEVGRHAEWLSTQSTREGKLCVAANAFLLWRMKWEVVEHPALLFWQRRRRFYHGQYAKWNPPDPSLSRWAIRRAFALDCLGVFEECVLLAKLLSRKRRYSFCPPLIEGSRKPYWTIERDPDGVATIHWWLRRRTLHFGSTSNDHMRCRPIETFAWILQEQPAN